MLDRLFYTVNSGLYFQQDGQGLLVDGVHHGGEEGFSEMPEQIFSALKRRPNNQTTLLFTHSHPDHFAPEMVHELIAEKQYSLWCPEQEEKHRMREIESFSLSGFTVHAIRTKHDGAQYSEVAHCSYLIETKQASFFVAGDAVLNRFYGERVQKAVRKPVKLAFINLYQAVGSREQTFLELLQPERICFYHLPFLQDDIFRLRWQTEQVAARLSGRWPVEVLRPMTQIVPKAVVPYHVSVGSTVSSVPVEVEI